MNMPLVLLNRRRRAGGFSPYVALFANNERGVFLDPSDTANLAWRRNLLTWTEQFDNTSVWTVAGVTAAANITTAPNGTSTADRLTALATTAIHRIISAAPTAASGLQFVHSVHVKAGTHNFVQLHDGASASYFANFDLSSGSLGTVTGCTAAITSVGDGWYRCSIAMTLNAANPILCLGIVSSATAARNESWTTAGTETVFVWGAQSEIASTASTYQVITDLNTEVRANFPNATLYQDTAGTTPVTTPGQSVALALDKSRGLVPGPELFSRTLDFSNAVWLKTAAVTSSGVQTFTTNAQGGVYSTIAGVSASARYRVRVTGTTTAQLAIRNDTDVAGQAIVPAGSFDVTLNSQIFSGSSGLFFQLGAAGTATITSVSIRELPGNHATQPTLGSAPRYATLPANGLRNLANGSASPAGADWITPITVNGITITRVATGLDVDGLPYADYSVVGTATANAVAGIYVTASSRAAAASGRQITGSILARIISGSAPPSQSGIRIDLYGETAPSTTTETFIGTLFRDTTEAVVSNTATLANVATNQTRLDVTSRTESGATVNYTVRIKALQFELGSTRTAYQFNYSNVNVAQPPFAQVGALLFDGVDDFLQTPSIDFSATDKMTVFAGVRKVSDAARGIVVELTNAASNRFGVEAPSFAAPAYLFTSFGTSAGQAQTTSFASPDTAVLTGVGDISGDIAILRRNGTQVATSANDQGTGNYSNAIIYIGRRAGTSLPFNGYLFPLIVRGAATSAGLISQTEAWVNQRTGAF